MDKQAPTRPDLAFIAMQDHNATQAEDMLLEALEKVAKDSPSGSLYSEIRAAMREHRDANRGKGEQDLVDAHCDNLEDNLAEFRGSVGA